MALGSGLGGVSIQRNPGDTLTQLGGLASRFNDWKPPVLPNVTQQATLFKSLFPDAGGGVSAVSTVQDFLKGLPAVPTIKVPTIPVARIAVPEGGYDAMQEAMFASQFDPVRRELERQGALAKADLQASLASRGLAESGVAVGQEQRVAREVGQRQEDAARDISAAATAERYRLQTEVATRQAALDQERALAGANLSVQAQTANARAILERGALGTDALVKALSLDVDRVNNLRSTFVQFFSAQTSARLQASEIARHAAADVFSAMLGAEDLRLRAKAMEPPPAPPPAPWVRPPQTYFSGNYGASWSPPLVAGLEAPGRATRDLASAITSLGKAR